MTIFANYWIILQNYHKCNYLESLFIRNKMSEMFLYKPQRSGSRDAKNPDQKSRNGVEPFFENGLPEPFSGKIKPGKISHFGLKIRDNLRARPPNGITIQLLKI